MKNPLKHIKYFLFPELKYLDQMSLLDRKQAMLLKEAMQCSELYEINQKEREMKEVTRHIDKIERKMKYQATSIRPDILFYIVIMSNIVHSSRHLVFTGSPIFIVTLIINCVIMIITIKRVHRKLKRRNELILEDI